MPRVFVIDMKSFSLLSLLLLVLVVALSVSHVVMMRRLADARAEVDTMRRKYGYIRVEQEQKIYMAAVGEQGRAFRIYIPPGHHYMLHLTESIFPDSEIAPLDDPTETLSMWNGEVDTILSYRIRPEGESMRVLIWNEKQTLFDYRLENWVQTIDPNVTFQVMSGSQKEFSPDEPIQILRWQNSKTGRGIMLWMESNAKWEAKRARQSSSQGLPPEGN